MRPTARLLASTSASLPLSISQASAQLIPPIPLYRRLLRVHRTLPDEMRFMGDSYVKSEFRLTRKTDNPLHIIGFLSQWKKYLDDLESDGGSGEARFKGRRLDMDSMDRMSKEQIGQLYELMHATKEVWKSPAELEQGAVEAEDRSSGKST